MMKLFLHDVNIPIECNVTYYLRQSQSHNVNGPNEPFFRSPGHFDGLAGHS